MTNRSYRLEIDGLRTWAIVPVVLEHAGLAGMHGGYIGVDVFFVISGFLIGGILNREVNTGTFSIVRFYERRLRRILPALLVVLVAIALFGLMFSPPKALVSTSKGIGATLLFVSNLWLEFERSDYFAPGTQTNFLLHTWSLAVEEQFYIVFPLLLWALRKAQNSTKLIFLAALALLSFAISVAITDRFPGANFYLPVTRAWELGAGVLLAMGGFGKATNKTVAELTGAFGLALLVIAIFGFDKDTPFPGVTALLPVVGATAVIWSTELHMTLVRRFLSTRVMVWIGLISYSLYLWHWPVMVALRLKLGTVELPVIWAWTAVVLSVILGWLSWRFIEAPFRTRPPNGFSAKAIFSMAGLASSAVLVGVAAIIGVNGLAARLSPEENRIAEQNVINGSYAASYDPSSDRYFLDIGAVDAGPPKVLFWGDSHAEALAPGVDAYFDSVGIHALLSQEPGCPPFPGLLRQQLRKTAACEARIENTLNLVETTPSIQTVILVTRWALYFEGDRLEGESGPAEDYLRPVGERKMQTSPQASGALAAKATEELIDRLRAMGRQVIVINSVPEMIRPVTETMLYHKLLGSPDFTPPSPSDVAARNAKARQKLEALAADPGVILVSPEELICTDHCAYELNGVPLYRDDDHLSDFGARQIVPELLASARTELQKSGKDF